MTRLPRPPWVTSAGDGNSSQQNGNRQNRRKYETRQIVGSAVAHFSSEWRLPFHQRSSVRSPSVGAVDCVTGHRHGQLLAGYGVSTYGLGGRILSVADAEPVVAFADHGTASTRPHSGSWMSPEVRVFFSRSPLAERDLEIECHSAIQEPCGTQYLPTRRMSHS